MTSNADYIRQWRRDNPQKRAQALAADRAKDRAYRRLREAHPAEFKRLHDEEREKEDLPPVRGGG